MRRLDAASAQPFWALLLLGAHCCAQGRHLVLSEDGTAGCAYDMGAAYTRKRKRCFLSRRGSNGRRVKCPSSRKTKAARNRRTPKAAVRTRTAAFFVCRHCGRSPIARPVPAIENPKSKTPVLGIDIGKRQHAAALSPQGEMVSQRGALPNTREGGDRLQQECLRTAGGPGTVLVTLEASAHYGVCLYHELTRRGHVVIDPCQTNARGRSRIRKPHNDRIDSEGIARLVLAAEARATRVPEEKTSEFRLGCGVANGCCGPARAVLAPCEALGVNTPEELAAVEALLHGDSREGMVA